jgi:predicted transcriptional regulator
MAKGVGKALEKALTKKETNSSEEEKGYKGKFEFGNANRRDIFSYLCFHPCSHISLIAAALKLSIHTTSWHLRRLENDGYISRASVGKKTVFYPTNMIDPQDISIFEILNNDKAKAIYIAVLDRSGINQHEICKRLGIKHQAVIWYTRKFESLSMIRSVEDGKFRRYYPTDLLKKKMDENASRMKIYRKDLLKRFGKEMMSPEVLRAANDKLVVKISGGKDKAVLTLHTNPFITVLM